MAKDPRGGARAGSGRKMIRLQELVILKMLKNAEDYEAKTGKSIDMILLDIIHDNGSADKDRLSAIKIFYDLLSRGSDQDDADVQTMGPAIYLPEKRPDPAKVVHLVSEHRHEAH
jgi:hypothetical protein